MGGGVHFMTGPAGIYYKPADKATGAYETHATFTQMEPAAHPEAYGLFIGGANLDAAGQKYTYFIVRQDGKYMIKRRAGADTPTDRRLDRQRRDQEAGQQRQDEQHARDRRRQGQGALPRERHRGHVGRRREGGHGRHAGLRVNHNLNLHVEGFAVKSR